MSTSIQLSPTQHRDPQLRSNRIAIVGFAETCWPPDSVWADPTIEKWTLNHGHVIDPRWDRLFEFHSRAVIDEEAAVHHRGVDQWAVLRNEVKRPIYMKTTEPDVSRSVRFPIESFKTFFGKKCPKLLDHAYVEMAAGYMLGYAIMRLLDFDGTNVRGGNSRLADWLVGAEIQVYGFELFDGEEYSHQRACFEFYAGWAMGAGIKMTVPETSAIFSSRGLYEYEQGESSRLLNQADLYLKQRWDEIKTEFAAASSRNAQAVGEMQTLSGIMQEVESQRKYVRHLLKGGNFSDVTDH